MPFADVMSGPKLWSIDQGDCIAWLNSLPEQSVDLVFSSPPYSSARLYLEGGQDLNIARNAEEWCEWMVEVTRAALRVCKGLVAWVVEDQTVDYSWGGAPMLLAADLLRASITMRRPCYYRRVGIPGSGGADWFRCDAELILCCTNGGKLPWADPTACGHPPKWPPGGQMSNRTTDGRRANDPWGKHGRGNSIGGRKKDGSTAKGTKRSAPSGHKDGDMVDGNSYSIPVLANPGNVIEETYTAEEVDALLGQLSEYVDCKVGGGLMGMPHAHKNEAPFPETLVERFVLSFCPPGGIVCDCFSGSGTTAAVAVRTGRRAVCCDLRQSQVELTTARMHEVTPPLFAL